MDASLRRAAEQEMRRPAPDAPSSKRPRTDCKDGEARNFVELGRFDYRAAEQLAQGAQGFMVTCGFQRGKSATREAIAALTETAARMSSSATPAFTTVKLPYCGVVLLTWRAAQEAHPSLPAPSAVVARLVHDVHSKKHPALRHVQRITPVDGVCLASTGAIRQLVRSLAEDFASGQDSAHKVPQSSGASDRPHVSFAVAFKNRCSEPQEQQTRAGSKGHARGGSSAGSVAVSVLDKHCHGDGQSHEQQIEQAARDAGIPVSRRKESSNQLRMDSAKNLTHESSRGDEEECKSKGEETEIPKGQGSSESTSISREAAIAAAAESFAAACKDAGIDAEVNLRQPGTVLCLEIVPVGSQAIAAVGIVESNACILKPKLSMKLLQLQIPN